jgi:hypothetical protein
MELSFLSSFTAESQRIMGNELSLTAAPPSARLGTPGLAKNAERGIIKTRKCEGGKVTPKAPQSGDLKCATLEDGGKTKEKK